MRATLLPLIEGYERDGQRGRAGFALSTLASAERSHGDDETAGRGLERMRTHAQAVGVRAEPAVSWGPMAAAFHDRLDHPAGPYSSPA